MTEPEPPDASASRHTEVNAAYLPAEPEPPRPSPRKAIIAFVVVVAIVLSPVVHHVWDKATSGPEAVVADYFEAIIAKDVELALSHVYEDGDAIPSGEAAVFLDPKAIAGGWELLDTEVHGDSGFDSVKVTVGHAGDRQTGVVHVQRDGEEWKVDDPFVVVSIAAGPLTYLRVNDKTVDLEELHAHDLTGLTTTEYRLFPGANRFFGNVKASTAEGGPAKLLFPPQEGYGHDVPVGPPDVQFTSKAVDGFQEALDEIIDDCAESTVRQPKSCPFGISPSYSDDGERRYEDIHDVTWKVGEYPRFDPESAASVDDSGLGVPIGVADPGEIELSATADRDGEEVELNLKCEFSAKGMRAALRPDGEPLVYAHPFGGTSFIGEPSEVDTCDNALVEDGDQTS